MFFSRANALENKRHVKSAKIGASLFFLTVATYSSLFYALGAEEGISGYWKFVVSINNFANFFIYFWIDKKFRKAVLNSLTLK